MARFPPYVVDASADSSLTFIFLRSRSRVATLLSAVFWSSIRAFSAVAARFRYSS